MEPRGKKIYNFHKVKTNHYYGLVFLTKAGDIYIDYSIRNEKNKIIFKRVNANKFYKEKKNADLNRQIAVGKVFFYLEKDGMELEDIPIDIIYRDLYISDDYDLADMYFFTATARTSNKRNDNIGIISLEDFLADEDIEEGEKVMITAFFNGNGKVNAIDGT